MATAACTGRFWSAPVSDRRGQRRYSNLAILTALTLRVVFGLPLRQSDEFLDSLSEESILNRMAELGRPKSYARVS